MKLKIRLDYINSFLKAVNAITSEANIKFTEYGMSCRFIDPANVSMGSIELSNQAFELFEVPNAIIGCDIVKLRDILSSSDKSEIIELMIDEETHKLEINLNGISYKIGLIDPESIHKEPKIPCLDLPFSVMLSGDQFLRGIKAAETISDYILMGCRDSNGFVFFMDAEGDTDKMTLEIQKDNALNMTPVIVKSLYSLDYLSKLAAVIGQNELQLKLSNDFPLIISTKFADQHGNLEYLLAPRVNDDQ